MGRDERWFRLHFRADEGGGGGAPAVEEGVDRGGNGGYDWGDQAETDYAKRFPGGPSEMFRSINEGTQKITQLSAAEQRAADLEEQLAEIEAERDARPWEDPIAALPSGVIEEGTRLRLEAVFADNPAQALKLAQEASPGYGNALQTIVMQAWLARDPWAALQHVVNGFVEPVLQERFQSFEELMTERLGPTVAHSIDQMNQAAIFHSRALAPDIADYEPRIEELLTNNPALIADVLGNVEKSADRLVQLRDLLAAADMRAAANGKKTDDEAATKKVKEEPARPRQASMGRGDVEGPALVDDDYAKAMSLKPRRPRGSDV